jgi:hypothetical protein
MGCHAGKGINGFTLAVVEHLPRKQFKVDFESSNTTLTGISHWFDIEYCTSAGGELLHLLARQASGIGKGKEVAITAKHAISWHTGATRTGGRLSVAHYFPASLTVA